MMTSTASTELHYSLDLCSLSGQPVLFLAATTEAGLCALLLDEPGQ